MDVIKATNELSFRVGLTGHSGHLRLEPVPPVERSNPLHSLPDFVIPPAFIEQTPESMKGHIEEKYLFPRLDPDEFSPEKAGRQWDFNWFDKAKIQLQPSEPRSTVIPKWELPFRRSKAGSSQAPWEPMSFEVDVYELLATEDSGAAARPIDSSSDFVRGSIRNRPFRPGGLDDSHSLTKVISSAACNGEWVCEVLNGVQPQTVPPGFKQGLDLGDLRGHLFQWNVHKSGSSSLDRVEDEKLGGLLVQFDDLFKNALGDDVAEKIIAEDEDSLRLEVNGSKFDSPNDIQAEESSLLDEILSLESREMLSEQNRVVDGSFPRKKEAWAVTGSCHNIADRFHELVPDMALEFPFELDKFQKEAIYYLERADSVFVAAHTSAGKTVVAEYAFALASKHCTRAVYTAPIKTISNQKYRDFCGKFDVGLLTGDVSLKPEASCLIMTTEILRSMLYKGADIIRDIEWVIFDEVHYVNDVERGVVWEEVIIMLPRHINIILLSATVPNTIEFADWIGRTKQKKIHVTGTTKRPVPLEHCLFYSGELYKICENEVFIHQGLKAAKDAHKKKNFHAEGSVIASSHDRSRADRRENPNQQNQKKHFGARSTGNLSRTSGQSFLNNGGLSSWMSRKSEASIWISLINMLLKKSLLPVIIFCFSKTRCDKSAHNLTGTDLTTRSEKSEIRVFCDKAFSRLKGSDRNLPQVLRVRDLLHRGIGVHHAGLLPIVKEVVEMLFCRGVVKILFSTETFAMGVNAPAKTVVFDTFRKFDGKEFRQLLPGEYTQMAGRAGRRGLDEIGTVVAMCRGEIPEERDLKHIMVGSATKLESQFRLTYIMILHLLRVEELKVEDMLKRSFAEFHAQKNLPEKQQLLMLKLAQPQKAVECIKGEPAIEEYYDLYLDAENYANQISEVVMQSSVAQKFISPGRIVVIKSQQAEYHFLGVVVKAPSTSSKQLIVLMLVPDLPPTTQSDVSDGMLQHEGGEDLPQGYLLLPKSRRGFDDDYYSPNTSRRGSGTINIKLPRRGAASGVGYEIREVDGKELLCICNCTIKVDQVGLLEEDSSSAYSRTVQQLSNLKSKGNKYPPALDPLRDLKLRDMELVSAYYKWNSLLQKMSESKCHGCIRLQEHIKWAKEVKRHSEEVNALKFQMSDEALQQMPEFYGRIDVLKELGCIDSDLVVQMKGRVACEMNSGEELICTECLFDNQLEELEPEEAVAIMSAFVFQQKNASEPSLTPKLSEARKRLYDTAIRLGEVQVQFNLPIDPREYSQENLKFGLVEVVYEWAKGTSFADICELTDVPEGMIVRTILRLDETCREFRNAAAIMGNPALHKKMEMASSAIRRDIVFAASLYITGI